RRAGRALALQPLQGDQVERPALGCIALAQVDADALDWFSGCRHVRFCPPGWTGRIIAPGRSPNNGIDKAARACYTIQYTCDDLRRCCRWKASRCAAASTLATPQPIAQIGQAVCEGGTHGESAGPDGYHRGAGRRAAHVGVA